MPRPRRKVTFRVLQLRKLLPLSQVRELPGVYPRTLEISGNRLEMATSVEINGAKMTDFGALSTGILVVRLPTSMRSRVQEVAVLSDNLDRGGSSIASYDLGLHPRQTDGKYRVLQQFVKLLLTTPGADVWSPSSGGGMRQILITNVDPQNTAAVSGEVESRVMNVTGQLLRAQAQDSSIPMSERLLKSVIDGTTFSTATQAVSVNLTLDFQDGSFLSADIGW